ncbi:class IIb bacteriocin, lactobin A/cerein 7B family [Collimonas silvisoli]|uniref:class IIb bacteriocin, lactobin A/cerein 7B family n=1 Tax=Collimonas silvisoli TaxID=2825884 RepID=UPI001B8CC8AA|nr:class IIb bacteriocin, lactobin A/cerein 7B family [Collimonas silvisoli]
MSIKKLTEQEINSVSGGTEPGLGFVMPSPLVYAFAGGVALGSYISGVVSTAYSHMCHMKQ